VERAAAGELPAWACVTAGRQAHIDRVAQLMNNWARQLAPGQADLWRAAAWLHDALRNAEPAALRHRVGAQFQDWPDALLHGPAAACQLLEEDPQTPPALLDAVAYHTVGHPRFGLLGRALYLADFLEPGRSFSPVWRASLRARLPAGLNEIVRDVVAARIGHLLRGRSVLRPETIDFWNALVTHHE
jgi:2-amino-4-hydroxy-6-hydroxymethyldihydropteridine diphosphokinase